MILNKPSKKFTKTDYLERLSAAEIEIADLKRQLAESESLRQVSEASLNEAEIEALFAAQYDIVFLFDTAMSLQRINPPFITYFGFNPVGLNVKEITHRVSYRRLDGTPIVWEEQPTPRALSDVKVTNVYFKVTRADGAEAIVETTSVPIVQNGYVTGSVTVWHDITKLAQTEQALSESEERYRLLYENSIDGILLTTPDGGILAANSAACRIFGRTEAEICRLGRNGLVDTSDPRVMPAVEERARTGHKKAEMFLVRGDGTRFTGEVTSTIFRGQDGRLMTSMIVRDITERRRAEDALRENEGRLLQAQELLEAITQGTDVIIAAVDTNYCYTFFNKLTMMKSCV
jgi:PAS domain S-box-containing protein